MNHVNCDMNAPSSGHAHEEVMEALSVSDILITALIVLVALAILYRVGKLLWRLTILRVQNKIRSELAKCGARTTDPTTATAPLPEIAPVYSSGNDITCI